MTEISPYTVKPFKFTLGDFKHYVTQLIPYLIYSFRFRRSNHLRWALHECYLDCGEWHETDD